MKKGAPTGRARARGRASASPSGRPRRPPSAFAERYREVVELAPIGIFTSTLEGRFLAANAALAQMLGYESVAEVLRIDIPRDLYVDPKDRARDRQAT